MAGATEPGIQGLLEDITSIRKNLEALHQEFRGSRERAQKLGEPMSRDELEQVLAQVKRGTSFTIDDKALAERIQPHLATPAKINAAIAGGLAHINQAVGAMPRTIRVEGELWGFTHWRAGALVAGSPLVVVLLMLWFTGMFSRVPLEKLQQAQTQGDQQAARGDSLSNSNELQTKLIIFRQQQIKAYVKKNSKAAADFPDYGARPRLRPTHHR